jgi:hypothetical protein
MDADFGRQGGDSPWGKNESILGVDAFDGVHSIAL